MTEKKEIKTNQSDLIQPNQKQPDLKMKDKSENKTFHQKRGGSLFQWFSELSKTVRMVILGACLLITFGIIYTGYKGIRLLVDNREGELISILETSLEKIEFRSSLSSLEYTYNSAVPVYKDGSDSKILYYVRYSGQIRKGIDFSKINIVEDPNDSNAILIELPPLTSESNVDPGSLDYIYVDNSAKSETIFVESYPLCEEDIRKAAELDSELNTIAKENVLSEIKLLTQPIVEQLDKEIEVNFGWSSDSQN